MAKISVNDEFIVNGVLTVKRYITEDNEIAIAGTFACHYYFEEIKKLETFRYSITGVEVKEEIFESDNFDIIYNFNAKAIDNKQGLSNLTNEEISKIEEEIYGKDGYVKGTVLEKGAL